jgi:branched-chain amino acid transport system permease protein
MLAALWLLLHRTRFGVLIRAATLDREMVGALGVNQAWLFTAILALGSALAAFGGALQMPREPASLGLDLATIGDAFVVVVVGGMGSLGGAYLAALIIATVKALCYGIGTVEIAGTAFAFSKLTLVVEFLVMAIVLIWRPRGLLGRALVEVRAAHLAEQPIRPMRPAAVRGAVALLAVLALVPLAADAFPYLTVLLVDVLIAVLFAASLHFIMGPAGLHSFGHAAYFGLGAYGAALLLRGAALPMEMALAVAPLVALVGAAVFGGFAVRLSGVYLSMLTLAFAQIVWSVVFQWDEFTGGSNGLIGIWPSERFGSKTAYYYLCLVTVAAGVWLLRRMLLSPFGYAMRAGRDAPLRAEATGIDVVAIRWAAFVVSGLFCGLAGALHAFAKGSISPEAISVARSVDGLVMVLLGGVQALAGPIVGAAVFTALQDEILRATDYWRALLGAVILLLVLAFPQGLVGAATSALSGLRVRRRSA